MSANTPHQEIELILGNSNPKFSGVTSTMLQTLAVQKTLIGVRVMGVHHLPEPEMAISFWQTVKMCQTPLSNGKWRVFHARRNDEMIQALLLKHVFKAKIKIVFTSTAQRRHTKFTRFLIRKMDAVISTCAAAASYLETTPAKIIPHGVRTDIFYPAKSRQESWRSIGLPGSRGIGILGRVRKQKGVHLFVRACIANLPKYPDLTAIVVGAITKDNTQFVTELKEETKAAGLEDRILFLGEQPFEKLPLFFRSLSLVAALSDNEGFGLTPLEAMASKTPTLTSFAGAWPEIISPDVDGTLVKIESQDNINHALHKLISQPDVLEEMGSRGFNKIKEKYTVEREAKALCNFFKEVQGK